MASITGGSVTFGRTVQPAQYESKKSEVTITFAVSEDDKPEDAIAILNSVSTLAQAKALELVNLKPAAKVAEKPAESSGAKPNPLAKITDEPRPGSKRPGRPPKNAEKPIPEADPLAAAEAPAQAANESAEAQAEIAKTNAKPDDADAALLGEAPPQPVSDNELMSAVTKKMAEIENGPAIKVVREKFVASPKGIRDIPQDKRREFLAELAKLKK